ncbi:MAG: glycosyltransferase family 9 protein [Bdellovibrionaceae bacterium]|nr:glycosyltransferase family 9 protein [Pseudobdellovibrionaceae bacterium]
MKILGMSLLRLGDLVLQRPLIEGLKLKHPGSEIHLLINKQFSQVEFLFAGIVDRFIYFDRDQLQKSCGENEFNIFWGLQNLKTMVAELNEEHYEVIYNFTHNRLTAHIAGLVNTKFQFGIYSEQGRFHGLNNPWIQFFNSYFGTPDAAGFHYTELLAKALEIPLKAASSKTTKANGQKLILIQPLTSDRKKNWQIESYQKLAKRIFIETDYSVRILGAPFEKEILSSYFSESELLICDFEEASNHIRSAALLVTGDTSVKHIAALHEVPILELSLGSSQPMQTGAYSHDSMILESRVACGPCPHSAPCSQSSQKCAEQMSVDAVFAATLRMIGIAKTPWIAFAQRYTEMNVYRTQINHGIGWTIECLSVGQKNNLDEVLQRKMMIVEELDRRHHATSKGAANERTRKLPDSGAEAS